MRWLILLVCIALYVSVAYPAFAAEIHDAARTGDTATLTQLLIVTPDIVNAPDERNSTPLHFACDAGQLEAAKLLLEHGANVSAIDVDGDTPLHWAAAAGRVELIELLIANAANVDAENIQIQTPLHYAAGRGQTAACKALLDAGANPDAREVEGYTPLCYAALTSNVEVIQTLVSGNANLETADNYGRTPLLLVARETGNADTARTLLAAGANINALDRFNDSPLTLAAWRGFRDIVDLLLDSGSEVNISTSGQSLLDYSSERGLDRLFFYVLQCDKRSDVNLQYSVEQLFLAATGGSPAIVGALLEMGLDPNAADLYGWTPLLYASRQGRFACVKQLAVSGADLNSRNKLGQTAYNLATLNENDRLAEWLSTQGVDTSPQRFPELSGLYMGQQPPGNEPVRFAVGIVDSPESEHTCISFSPDGFEAYWDSSFDQTESGYSISKVFTSHVQDGIWTVPCPTEFSRTCIYNEGDPCIAPDGKHVFFYSRRPVSPGGPEAKENVWFVEKTGTGWSEPQILNSEVNEMDVHWQISVDLNGNLYVGATDGRGYGGGDIFRCAFVNGEYLPPENLGNVINTPANEGTPFITPDGKLLLFTRQNSADTASNYDIYFSTRLSDGTWATPQSIGQPVNTAQNEFCPTLTPDLKYLFYLSEGMYWVSVEGIPALATALSQR